jgi:hypothetical protein
VIANELRSDHKSIAQRLRDDCKPIAK